MVNIINDMSNDSHIVKKGSGSAAERNEMVGSRLKALREMYGLSQRELAKRTGVTNGMISLIEQNQVSPSVSSLKKVLEGFPLSLADFFSWDLKTERKIFYAVDELTEIAGGKISFRQVGARSQDRKLQVLHERYEPGGDTGKEMISHEGEESGVVMRGQIEITVGGKSRVLGPGEAYYFDSRLPHRFRNTGREVCEIVSVCTPPTF